MHNGNGKGPNWELGKSLYLKGVKAPQIATAIGAKVATVRKRIVRHQWLKLKVATTEALLLQDATLKQKSVSVRHSIADLTVRNLSIAKQETPKTFDDAERHQEFLNKAASTSEKTFGWGAGDGRSDGMFISIENLTSCVVEDRSQGPKQVQPGDVFICHRKGDPFAPGYECSFEEFISQHPEQAQFYIRPQPVIDVQPIQPETNGAPINGDTPH